MGIDNSVNMAATSIDLADNYLMGQAEHSVSDANVGQSLYS